MQFDQQDPFEGPPQGRRPAHPHRAAAARHHGAAHHPRHQGVAHHPHGHGLAAQHGLHHPHQAAVAHHPAQRHGGQGQSGGQGGQGGRRTHSHIHLSARSGLQKIEVGVIQSYNAAANTALVRIVGAQTNLVGPLPLSQGLPPALATAGATCLAALLDEANPADAAIVAIYNAPPAWVQAAGGAVLAMSGPQLAQAVSFPLPFANGIAAVAACSRDPTFTASVSGESTGGFVLTLTRREGATQLQTGAINVPVGTGASSGWASMVSAPSATGATVSVASTGAVGPATITVYWQATGDPAVSATVGVDWVAVGT